MATEVLLLKNVKHVGKVGEVVSVRDGYARNYLIPQQIATVATKSALRQIEAHKARIQKEYEEAVATAQQVAKELSAVELTLALPAGDDGRLYGSVTTHQVADAFAKLGKEVNKRDIDLKGGIRTVGEHNIGVEVHADVEAIVVLNVVSA